MQIENKGKILFYLLWRIKEIVEILSRTTSLFLDLQQTHRRLLFNKKPGIALPGIFMVELTRIELATSSLRTRRSPN